MSKYISGIANRNNIDDWSARASLHFGPVDDLQPSIEVLDDRRAAFDPVAAIDINQPFERADDRVVYVPADDALRAPPPRLVRQCQLKGTDEIDCVLDLELCPPRQP